MVEVPGKEVRVSEQFNKDIIDIYCFGEESFGNVAARSFLATRLQFMNLLVEKINGS